MPLTHQIDDRGNAFDFVSDLDLLAERRQCVLHRHSIGVRPARDHQRIVSAVIDLGRSFHLQVIAEGVETRDQFLALQARDCAEGQGYYFQEPVEAGEFVKLLGADMSVTVLE
jgi:EAL domain-containing protein (putative c-di-GMP-specific phosphodiesterase class I)